MLKVMIVEDDFMIADGLEEILIGAGYEVCGITGKVDAAIAMGKKFHPDLGVIDLRLANGGFGTEVAAALCPGGKFGVLYASGNPDHPLLVGAEGEGCIAKPYTASTIVAALEVVNERMSQGCRLLAYPEGFRSLRA
jgi:DNA-binding response OmpR family regulator